MDTPLETEARHTLIGRASLRRVAPWGFPAAALVGDDGVVALLGRMGWFRIYFGRGQRIELADGTKWTLTSIATGGAISPLIVDGSGRRVTLAGMRHGTYGINGRDYAAVLVPADASTFGRSNRWMLGDETGDLAVIQRSPLSVTAQRPVHLGAVLIALALVRFGLPEESSPRMAPFHW